MFQKRDAAVPQFWIWKKCRITETTPSSKFSDTDFSKKSFEKSPLWKLPESDIFLTFDVFEEKFVWRDKTYAPWNCWVITFTLTPCDDFINDLEPPLSFIISFEFISDKKTGINRREANEVEVEQIWPKLVGLNDSQENQTFEFGKKLAPLIKHQDVHQPSSINHSKPWSHVWASNISLLSDANKSKIIRTLAKTVFGNKRYKSWPKFTLCDVIYYLFSTNQDILDRDIFTH